MKQRAKTSHKKATKKGKPESTRRVLDAAFAARLNRACDDIPTVVPPHGRGRLVVMARELKVSQEAVRRWFVGEARPRVRLMKELANLIHVDEAYLSLGVEPQMTTSEKLVHHRQTDAAALFALALAKFVPGSSCSVPQENDPQRGFVDFYLTKNGRMSPIKSVVGVRVAQSEWEFKVPREYEHIRVIGFIEPGESIIQMLDLDSTLITKYKETKEAGYMVSVKRRDDRFISGRDTWTQLKSFGELV